MSYLGVAMILGVRFMRTFRENKIIFTPNAIKKNKDKKLASLTGIPYRSNFTGRSQKITMPQLM